MPVEYLFRLKLYSICPEIYQVIFRQNKEHDKKSPYASLIGGRDYFSCYSLYLSAVYFGWHEV